MLTGPGPRFVALGDSITVGLGDPMADGTWRGWASLLAEALGPPGTVEFHNLARLGALSRTVAQSELPRSGLTAGAGCRTDAAS